jgi:cytochrome P450
VLDGAPGSSLLADAAGHAAALDARKVVSNAAVMLFAGIETTEGMIANAIVHLLSNPASSRS